MKFEERLSEIINEVPVPDELSPQNIAVMLREKSAESEAEKRRGNIKKTSAVSARKSAAMTFTAVAACAVLAVGTIALRDGGKEQVQLEAPISYEAVSPDSYDTLYNIYTGITLKGGEASDSDRTIDEEALDADIVKTDENYMYCLKGSTVYIISLETMEVVSEIESSLDPPAEMYIEGEKLILISKEKEEVYIVNGGNKTAVTEPPKAGNSAAAPDVPAQEADTYQPAETDSGIPDKALSDEKTVSAYGDSPDKSGNGKSAIPAAQSSGLNSASRTNAAVDVYNISDPANPVRTAAYKQNGSYITSKISDGVLYMATAYSDYRVKPLDTQADLDSFVPAYYINGKKTYLAAEDIIIPGGVTSTDYTVISAIDTNSGGTSEISVKAVLGSSRNVYCSDDTLYVAAVGKKDKTYSVISSFDLTGGGISYRASGSVEGEILGKQSMDEYGGLFRTAAETTDKNEKKAVSVYVLDRSLTAVNSAGQLFAGGKASAVKFEKNYATIIDAVSGEPAATIDLSSNPPALIQTAAVNSASLCSYSDDTLLEVGKTQDNSSLTLTMYSSENGLAVSSVSFGKSKSEIFSEALSDSRAVLIDKENGLIGVPAYCHNEFGIKNSYYVFSYSPQEGFSQKGVIEYVDPDDSMVFRQGEIIGDTLYVIGGGRIISARLSDLKIIGTYEY